MRLKIKKIKKIAFRAVGERDRNDEWNTGTELLKSSY